MKKIRYSQKGITLIALIITIILMLILAGVVISLALGENGLFKMTRFAKIQYEKASIKEQIELAVLNSRIDNGADLNIDTSILEKELNNFDITDITKDGENGGLPWTIAKDGYVYTISKTGEVEERIGIMIENEDITFIQGDTREIAVTAKLLNNEKGTIKWSCTGNIVLSTLTGETTKVKLNDIAKVGDVGTITAELEAKYMKDTINVKVLDKVTGLAIEPIKVSVGENKIIENITVNPINAEEVTPIKFVSENTNVATVNESTGEVTGVQVGNTNIVVTAKGNLSNEEVIGTCEVTVEKAILSLTAQQIAENPKAYYGKQVLNYKANDSDTNVYRIFYVDVDDDFGDGENTIYLKADYIQATSGYYKTSYDANQTKVKEMNPLWAVQRGEASWNYNEKGAAWLCDPSQWTNYCKQNDDKVNYAIGGPSIEMYAKSYNQTHDKDSNGNEPLGCGYQASPKPGYSYKIYGVNTLLPGNNTLDYTNYGRMYCTPGSIGGGTGTWLIASPHSNNTGYGSICSIYGDAVRLSYCHNSVVGCVSPLVSLKSNYIIKVEK